MSRRRKSRRGRTENQGPSLKKILSQDYIANIGFLFSAILILVALIGTTVGNGLDPSFIQMAWWIIPLGLGIAFWRVREIRETFQAKRPAEDGRLIAKRSLSKCWGLEYRYTYEGRGYQRTYFASGGSIVGSLEAGDDIEVIVKPKAPEKGLIEILFA